MRSSNPPISWNRLAFDGKIARPEQPALVVDRGGKKRPVIFGIARGGAAFEHAPGTPIFFIEFCRIRGQPTRLRQAVIIGKYQPCASGFRRAAIPVRGRSAPWTSDPTRPRICVPYQQPCVVRFRAVISDDHFVGVGGKLLGLGP